MSKEPNGGQYLPPREELVAAVLTAAFPHVLEQVMGEELLWPEQAKLFPDVKEEAF